VCQCKDRTIWVDYRIYDGWGWKNEARPCSRYVTQPGVQQQLPFARVLMDSWYAAQKLMALIEQLGKIFTVLKRNRLVDDSGGVENISRLNN